MYTHINTHKYQHIHKHIWTNKYSNLRTLTIVFKRNSHTTIRTYTHGHTDTTLLHIHSNTHTQLYTCLLIHVSTYRFNQSTSLLSSAVYWVILNTIAHNVKDVSERMIGKRNKNMLICLSKLLLLTLYQKNSFVKFMTVFFLQFIYSIF